MRKGTAMQGPLLILITGLALAGCGSAQTVTTEPAPTLEPTHTANPPSPTVVTTTELSPTPAVTSTITPNAPLAVSIDDLQGVWYAAGYYMRYIEDGHFSLAYSIDELDSEPSTQGVIWFEEDQLYIRDNRCGDQIGIYEVRLYPDGIAEYVRIEDRCDLRALNMPTRFEREE